MLPLETSFDLTDGYVREKIGRHSVSEVMARLAGRVMPRMD
jgi:predicted CopG family antitoxin